MMNLDLEQLTLISGSKVRVLVRPPKMSQRNQMINVAVRTNRFSLPCEFCLIHTELTRHMPGSLSVTVQGSANALQLSR